MSRERRRMSRADCAIEARYRPAGSAARPWHAARALNLSAGGVRLCSDEALPPGIPLDIQLLRSANPQGMSLRGAVIWTHMQAPLVVEHGVAFLDVTPQQQGWLDDAMHQLS